MKNYFKKKVTMSLIASTTAISILAGGFHASAETTLEKPDVLVENINISKIDGVSKIDDGDSSDLKIVNNDLNSQIVDTQDTDKELSSESQKKTVTFYDGTKNPKEYITEQIIVGAFLSEIGVQLNENDEVAPSVDKILEDPNSVKITRYSERKYKKKKSIKYDIKENYTMNLKYGKKKVTRKGEKGQWTITYLEKSRNGEPFETKKLTQEKTKKPVTKKVLIGAKQTKDKKIQYKTKTINTSTLYKGQKKVIQKGKSGKIRYTYYNDGKKKKLVSTKTIKSTKNKIVKVGTKKKITKTSAPARLSSPSSAKYTLAQFKYNGVVRYNGKKFTYYSQSVLPGRGLNIPGRHVSSAGYVSDENGYIVVAANRSIRKGTIIKTPFGANGKVYDTCAGCSYNWIDVYIK